ncbi:MAG: hypothetical protein KA403_03055 [Candidatus Omnitrophica bacterium]|nr:hypothetical protein [Candidatus Omnitrophota bacterium]
MPWGKMSVWNFILRRLAKAQGFLDPTVVFSKLQKFSQPSEVWVPTELLRSGAVLQARGLINSQAIQHNLDWIWPYWVEQQFSPQYESFIPRAFNITHINLTCRNWTAVGMPDLSELPIVDPKGLVTPLFDGWSLDGWVVTETQSLIPSRLADVEQKIAYEDALTINTFSQINNLSLKTSAHVQVEGGIPVCKISFKAMAGFKAWLVIALRPYNPEGISMVHQIKQISESTGWEINGHDHVYLNEKPSQFYYSNYESGDIYEQLIRSKFSTCNKTGAISCTIGMASSAAVYPLEPNQIKEVTATVPLSKTKVTKLTPWAKALGRYCRLVVPDKQFQFLYDVALRTIILHSPGSEVFPGPFTYKRFWFRDAAFILNAMVTSGLLGNTQKIIDGFSHRQTPLGYFKSQDGEWDSNGQALWIMDRFLTMTGSSVNKEWLPMANKAVHWIERKLLSMDIKAVHAGLMPPGFSAEHFGPSDYYYWDDFWAAAGLKSAAHMFRFHDDKIAKRFTERGNDVLFAIDRSLANVQSRLNRLAVPSSPYRRLDSGVVGCLIASYPLQLWPARDPRILDTMEFLLEKYMLNGALYHELSHSGINAYLSLHLAQALLRAGDDRFFNIVKSVADLASPTGQWPEAIHPRTGGGCMGDGQHVWAAAEWILMVRNMFVREELEANTVILLSGIPKEWIRDQQLLSLGPTLTPFGDISVSLNVQGENVQVNWQAAWNGQPPSVEINLAGYERHSVTGESGVMVLSPKVLTHA